MPDGDIVKFGKCIFIYLNTINLKIFSNHGGVYTFERKFTKCSGDKSLRCLRKQRDLLFKVNSMGM